MKKSDFIDKYLLDVCVQKVKDTDDDIREANMKLMMSMSIFPYESKEHDGYSNLTSEDKFWYYRTDGNDVSAKGNSSNYRILDEKRLSSNHSKAIKDIFGESGENCVKKYSSQSIINDLIDKMSTYSDYTEDWWSCVRDIYNLWDGKNPGDQFKKATESIIGNYFLFDSKCYCDNKTKQLLIKYGVYSDILEHKFFSSFFENNNIEKVSKLLGYLGVPNELASNNDGKIESNLFKFITHWADRVQFPINQSSNEYEKCELIERVVKDVLYSKYEWPFNKMLVNSECRKGIVVKNIHNQYVPISVTLFYNVQDLDYYDNSCYMLLINENGYQKKYLERISTDVKSDMDPSFFDFNSLGERKPFKNILKLYSWLWQFNQSLIYASNVIKSLADCGEVRSTDDDTSEFIIDLLLAVNGNPPESVDFTVIMSEELSWNRAKDVNDLFINYFESDSVSIICSEMDIQKFDTQEIKSHILADVNQDLYNEWFWDRIYISDKYSDEEEYLILNKELGDPESILILRGNSDEKAYIRLIKRFIQQYYKASVNNLDEGIIDWKKEYDILASGIRKFVSEKESVKYMISFNNIKMDDVSTYSREKAIWKEVKDTRKNIRSAKSMPDLSKILGTREFLNSTYHGYCQLCKGKTCTSDVYSHFYTYRIVKPSKLSDPDFADMAANLFSVCPTCHGSLNYGKFMGFDMSNIISMTRRYVKYFLDSYEEFKNIDNEDSLISELQDESISCDKDGMIENPIVIKVTVNGEEKDMFFSWEHFIRLAMILNEDLIYNDD